MPFCTNCRAQVQSSDRFCGNCGRPVEATLAPAPPFTAPSRAAPTAVVLPRKDGSALPYLLSPTRVLVMTVLSYGFYLFYWFYLTWRQYRDHTGHPAFPVWHALTMLVPVYGLFRVHAHIRSFRELMAGANVPCSLSAGWSVALVMVSSVLDWASFQVSGGFEALLAEEAVGPETARTAALAGLMEVVSILLVAGLLLHTQGNLNRYWANLEGKRPVSSGVSPGEVAFVLLGVFFWLSTLASVLGFGPENVAASISLNWPWPGR
ncbi:MAG TPA: zinc ribbon domain-containing protein [Dehalococcoidia bacterium]|nr:zinc ribbon domain-containing protein [Dehalococcoidia bacterium]